VTIVYEKKILWLGGMFEVCTQLVIQKKDKCLLCAYVYLFLVINAIYVKFYVCKFIQSFYDVRPHYSVHVHWLYVGCIP